MRILAIETSCDETAMALIHATHGARRPSFLIRKNVVASQIKIHAPFGGVVPNLAKREHLKNLPVVFKKVFGERDGKGDIDLIAATIGPGLEPALWTGINFAKDLAKKWRKPLIGVNHLEGHLYSFLLSPEAVNIKNLFPAVSLIVSGGHTTLLLLKNFSRWKKLGETRDDAAGEAFDKVARMLNLPYPGGPVLEKLAARGHGDAISFPRPMIGHKNFDFSFSGLKTSVFYYLRDLGGKRTEKKMSDVAASFEQAVVDVLSSKTRMAAERFGAQSIMLSGGVAANKNLRDALNSLAKHLGMPFFVAPKKFNTDNAAMIGVAAYFNYLDGRRKRLTAQAHLNI